MKWVTTSEGKIPEGYTPVQGGYEIGGEQLYHAVAKIDGVWVPGKTGTHLHGANFPYNNREIRLVSSNAYKKQLSAYACVTLLQKTDYRVLCWLPGPPAPS